MLYRGLLFYSVYGFLKRKKIRGNWFKAISCFIFVSPNSGGCIYTNFPVFTEWIIWVFYLNHWNPCKGDISLSVGNKENCGIPCIASCWVLPFSRRHIKWYTKWIEFQINFSENIYLFKANNRKTKERFEIVQS